MGDATKDRMGEGEMQADENYSRKLASILNDYRKNKAMCDVILVVPPKEYLAHRNVVCASSPYLLEYLGSDASHTTLGSRVELKTINYEVMEDILNFMYIGEICVGEDNVRKLVSASDVLQMKNLKEISCRFYEKRLCPGNCLSIAALADEFNCDSLRSAADQYILQNFLDVCRYSEFKALSMSHVQQLLSSNLINVDNEEQLYEAAMDWIDHDSYNRKCYLSSLLSCIRLLETSKYFISDVLEKDENIMADSKCIEIIKEAKFIFDFPDRKHMIKHRQVYEPREFSDRMDIIVSCGGNQERMSSNEVLCYIPTQDFWYPLAPLKHFRFASSSVVRNNEILCIGGKRERVTCNIIERYSVGLDKWIEDAPLPYPISHHVSCIFNGELYVIGGSDQNEKVSSKVMKYSVKNGKWVYLSDLKVPRKHAAIAVHKNLYVIGGYDANGLALASVERYNPYGNEWSKIFPMNSARACASAVCVENSIYVFGGEYAMWSYYRSAEVFSIKTDEWKSIADMSIPRALMGISLLNNQIYLVGGMVSMEGGDQSGFGDDDEDFVDANETNLVESYNVDTDTWKRLSSIPVATAGPDCVAISMSKSYLQSRYGF